MIVDIKQLSCWIKPPMSGEPNIWHIIETLLTY